MGLKLTRKKIIPSWVKVFYRIHKLLPLSSSKKLKIYLNFTWFFERLAHEMSFSFYDADEHPVRKFQKSFFDKHILPHYRILDIGCNNGEITDMAAANAKEVIGIDLNDVAVENARRNYQRPNLHFVQGDAREFLEKNTSKFDVLILAHILEHLDNPGDFIMQFKDFFRFIYIELPDYDKTFLNHYRTDLKLKLNFTDDDHVSEFDRHELRNILDQVGVDIIESNYIFGHQQLWCEVRKITAG